MSWAENRRNKSYIKRSLFLDDFKPVTNKAYTPYGKVDIKSTYDCRTS